MKGYIYKIVNDIDGRFYIGSTIVPQEREIRHFRDLKEGKHHSIFLQRAYDKYGEEHFSFNIVKERDFESEDELRLLEERYINFCWNSGKLYNVSKKGCGGDLVSYHPLLDEIKDRKRKASLEVWNNKSEEYKQEYSQKMRGRGNPNFGNKWEDWQRERASKYWKEYFKTHDNFIKGKTFEEAFGEEKAKQMKQRLSEFASQKTGEKNSFYGKHHSKESREKMSKARKGVIPSNSKKVEYNGKVYPSAGACAKEINMNHMTVCYKCRNELDGFRYISE